MKQRNAGDVKRVNASSGKRLHRSNVKMMREENGRMKSEGSTLKSEGSTVYVAYFVNQFFVCVCAGLNSCLRSYTKISMLLVAEDSFIVRWKKIGTLPSKDDAVKNCFGHCLRGLK
jgi:hypothetical protein